MYCTSSGAEDVEKEEKKGAVRLLLLIFEKSSLETGGKNPEKRGRRRVRHAEMSCFSVMVRKSAMMMMMMMMGSSPKSEEEKSNILYAQRGRVAGDEKWEK